MISGVKELRKNTGGGSGGGSGWNTRTGGASGGGSGLKYPHGWRIGWGFGLEYTHRWGFGLEYPHRWGFGSEGAWGVLGVGLDRKQSVCLHLLRHLMLAAHWISSCAASREEDLSRYLRPVAFWAAQVVRNRKASVRRR